MGIKILRLRHRTAPAPEGCRWCGIEHREHANQWAPSQQWHTYVQPTQDQIKARMRVRLLPQAPSIRTNTGGEL